MLYAKWIWQNSAKDTKLMQEGEMNFRENCNEGVLFYLFF